MEKIMENEVQNQPSQEHIQQQMQLHLQLRVTSLELSAKLNPTTASDLITNAIYINKFLLGIPNE
jgi:hypothetical protein